MAHISQKTLLERYRSRSRIKWRERWRRDDVKAIWPEFCQKWPRPWEQNKPPEMRSERERGGVAVIAVGNEIMRYRPFGTVPWCHSHNHFPVSCAEIAWLFPSSQA